MNRTPVPFARCRSTEFRWAYRLQAPSYRYRIHVSLDRAGDEFPRRSNQAEVRLQLRLDLTDGQAQMKRTRKDAAALHGSPTREDLVGGGPLGGPPRRERVERSILERKGDAIPVAYVSRVPGQVEERSVHDRDVGSEVLDFLKAPDRIRIHVPIRKENGPLGEAIDHPPRIGECGGSEEARGDK